MKPRILNSVVLLISGVSLALLIVDYWIGLGVVNLCQMRQRGAPWKDLRNWLREVVRTGECCDSKTCQLRL